ncbi:WhiB family transcriptional regulator [Streptomyces mirabilis]|uniref:WhiB family transcriptional regulator n=1 Tax=Streptomyces sp. NPDC005388 TaxID=3156717 RepID=UPI0033A2F4F8
MSGYTGDTPDTVARPLDWMDSMACRSVDPDLFSDPATTHQARIICIVRCPVRTACLARVKETEQGTSPKDRDGVVAGLTGSERWRLDPTAYRTTGDAPWLDFEVTRAPCGTYLGLLRHLWSGERIDPDCWSNEVRRERLNSATRAATAHPRKEV